jgi:hypothetical protein
MTVSTQDAAKIIRELLRIAKVAMPPDLYHQVPRVLTAMAALKEMESSPTAARPPNITGRLPSLNPGSDKALEMSPKGVSFVFDIPWDLAEPLAQAQEDHSRLDLEEITHLVLRDWLTGHGYLPPGPEDPN